MVLDTGGFGTVGSGYHEVLWSVLMSVVNKTQQGLHPELYNGMFCLAAYYRDEEGWNTWNILSVISLRVNNFLLKYQKFVWYQYHISLEEHRLVGALKFGQKDEIN